MTNRLPAVLASLLLLVMLAVVAVVDARTPGPEVAPGVLVPSEPAPGMPPDP